MEQAALVDDHPIGDRFDRADLFEIIRPTRGCSPSPGAAAASASRRAAHELIDIVFGHPLDPGRTLAIECRAADPAERAGSEAARRYFWSVESKWGARCGGLSSDGFEVTIEKLASSRSKAVDVESARR